MGCSNGVCNSMASGGGTAAGGGTAMGGGMAQPPGFTYLTTDPALPPESFGSAVAIDASGNTVAVSSLFHAFVAGQVEVFTKDGLGYTRQAVLTAMNAEAGDQFGQSISISSDGNVLAIGAPSEDSQMAPNENLATGSGAAYVFVRTQNTWNQVAYLKASNVGEEDGFGTVVTLSADGKTLAISAPLEDSSSATNQLDNQMTQAGAVYVFGSTSFSTWIQQAYVKATHIDALAYFGNSLSLSSNGNTLAVGAPDEDVLNDTSAGAAYIFSRSNVMWNAGVRLVASNVGVSDAFGYSVSLSGDGLHLAVGAPSEDSDTKGVNPAMNNVTSPYRNFGAAYLFTSSAGSWSQNTFLKATNTHDSEAFGAKVSFSSNGNTLAVSAPTESSDAKGLNGIQTNFNATNSGSAYLFKKTAGWAPVHYVKASVPQAFSKFASSMQLSKEGTVGVFGAPTERVNLTANAGAVYVISLP
jgi:FG-GAP repeat